MKLKFKALISFFVLSVSICIGLGLFFSYRTHQVSRQQLASITVSTKQKSLAHELAQRVLNLQNVSSIRSITEDEIKGVKALLFRWEAAQKALVNGDDAYGVIRADSKALVAAIQNTSSSFIQTGDAIRKLIKKENNWSDEELNQISTSIDDYTTKVNDVIVLVNEESDEVVLSMMIQLGFLILISLATILLGGYFFLKPVLARGLEAEDIKETASGELEILRQEKSEFLTQLSNEIKTPLSGVIGMTDLLLKTKLDEEQLRYSRSIRSGSSRLMDLVNDIIDHTLMESGELEIEKDSFEFNETMEQVMDLMRPLAMEKGIELILDVDQRIPLRLIQDERRLRQVLINIIGNAIKFTERGEVFVKVELLNEESGFVQLKTTISDTGIGMDVQTQRRVFGSFTQGATAGDKANGAGLGLFISKKLIDKMGGRIWLESSPNHGTKVYYTLVAESEGLLPMSKVSALNGKKVLVVDDNKTSLKILVKQLSSYGMQAIPFNSPDLVEDMIGNLTRFDLAVIDLEMPKINGVSLAERIREKYPNDVLPMIVMSQTGNKVFENKSTLFDAYITKPVKQSKLLETVVSVMEIKKGVESTGKHEGNFARKHLNILIAHDNELTRAVAVKNLSLLGHKCSEAHNGDQIIELAGKLSYDMVLVDTEVESMRGLEAVRKLRQITSEDKMPLIVGLVENINTSARKEVKGIDTILNRKLETEDVQKTIDEWFISPHE